jgi:hypothetical protein
MSVRKQDFLKPCIRLEADGKFRGGKGIGKDIIEKVTRGPILVCLCSLEKDGTVVPIGGPGAFLNVIMGGRFVKGDISNAFASPMAMDELTESVGDSVSLYLRIAEKGNMHFLRPLPTVVFKKFFKKRVENPRIFNGDDGLGKGLLVKE